MIAERDSRGQSMVIQETSIPRALAPVVSNILRWSRAYARGTGTPTRSRDRLRLGFDSTQCYAVTAHDDAGGRVVVEEDRVRLRWPGAGLQPIVGTIHDKLNEATRALGGELVVNPAWDSLSSHPPMTTHPLGGCAMAADGAHGVTDHRGRVFSGDGTETHAGLFVCDGSVIPGALGCNPLLTISALAERAAELLASELAEKSRVERPRNRPVSAPPQDVGLHFTERMTGHWSHPNPHFSFVCTLLFPSLDAILSNPAEPAMSVGTLEAPGLSPHPLTVERGHFQLLVPHDDGTLRMVHQLQVRDREGHSFFVDGYKTIDRTRGRGMWPDTTTLFFSVHEGKDARGKRLGDGSVVVRISDLVKQVSTMRGDRAGGALGSAHASFRFVRSFATQMMDTYVLRRSREMRARAKGEADDVTRT